MYYERVKCNYSRGLFCNYVVKNSCQKKFPGSSCEFQREREQSDELYAFHSLILLFIMQCEVVDIIHANSGYDTGSFEIEEGEEEKEKEEETKPKDPWDKPKLPIITLNTGDYNFKKCLMISFY